MFYIIEEGHVECLQVVHSGQRARERLVRKLTSGDHFGEVALMRDNEIRTMTIRCGSEQAKLLALDRQTFNRILGQIDQYLQRDYSQEIKSFSISSESEHSFNSDVLLQQQSLLEENLFSIEKRSVGNNRRRRVYSYNDELYQSSFRIETRLHVRNEQSMMEHRFANFGNNIQTEVSQSDEEDQI